MLNLKADWLHIKNKDSFSFVSKARRDQDIKKGWDFAFEICEISVGDQCSNELCS